MKVHRGSKAHRTGCPPVARCRPDHRLLVGAARRASNCQPTFETAARLAPGCAGRESSASPFASTQSLTDSGMWRIVKRAAAAAGLQAAVSAHWLRHDHASHALDRGTPIHLVQATHGACFRRDHRAYLHARPKESSEKYLGLGPYTRRISLHSR